ncbi:MAG TPA: bifunctional [glutamate--ammonia ligase]-adenylyl-L-tyrosine phosphorylase/[glutamate--ammonia-ligase] adenylyltransferase, partial [Gemmatales bacterium]|nr:bifunctional [glutamate--ammonia ligase]-adenylyl-L-tyrosine phosphorylase/[glutamate--ammonia-ligase] adenylyltransferase [Gemmatales bacterium]
GYHDGTTTAEDQFEDDFETITAYNRAVLNHLLHDAFQEPSAPEIPESDLILLPEDEKSQAILSRYRFRDTATAFRNLQLLAEESVPFLPTRRCRHFLAGIAPKLLAALADTPDPDMALTNLEKVTSSLGAKGVLWELFSYNEPSLKLYVDLCANSQFLSQILMSHPGMIDELLDSLVLDQPKSLKELEQELQELCRGAEPHLIDRILHSFQNKELLRIGVQDILGKRPLPETLLALSDLAETVLGNVVERELE